MIFKRFGVEFVPLSPNTAPKGPFDELVTSKFFVLNCSSRTYWGYCSSHRPILKYKNIY